MPDIRIDYADKPPGYVEVVVDIEPSYAAVAAQIWKPFNPLSADMTWKVHVTGQANLKQLQQKLPKILGNLQHPPEPLAEQEIARMGVTVLEPWTPGPNRPAGIYLAPEGIRGSAALLWKPLLEWIKTLLESDGVADVRKKLAATGAAERHAFIGASFTSPGDAYFALRREGWPELPPSEPIPAARNHPPVGLGGPRSPPVPRMVPRQRLARCYGSLGHTLNPPACKDRVHGGLTWPSAGAHPCGVSVNDRDLPLITVRSVRHGHGHDAMLVPRMNVTR